MKRLLKSALAAAVTLASSSAFALVPPEWSYWLHVKASLGADSCVQVPDLIERDDHTFDLKLEVCDDAKARALAQLVKAEDTDAGVKVSVIRPNGQVAARASQLGGLRPDQIAEMYRKALTGNPYFSAAGAEDAGFYQVWVEFKPRVIQVQIDNIASRHGYATHVAQAVFNQVMDDGIFAPKRVVFDTAPVSR